MRNFSKPIHTVMRVAIKYLSFCIIGMPFSLNWMNQQTTKSVMLCGNHFLTLHQAIITVIRICLHT